MYHCGGCGEAVERLVALATGENEGVIWTCQPCAEWMTEQELAATLRALEQGQKPCSVQDDHRGEGGHHGDLHQ